MNSQHRAIRALLTTMAPRRAEAYIRAFELPEDEEAFLIACDVRGLSCMQAAAEFHTSLETVKRRRQSAYRKIADDMTAAGSQG